MEKKGEEVVKDTLVPIKTRYLVIDNGGKSSYYTFPSLNLTRTIYHLCFITSGYVHVWACVCGGREGGELGGGRR